MKMEGSLIQEFFRYFTTKGSYIFEVFLNHLLMSVYGVLFASIAGIPLGILIASYAKITQAVIMVTNIIQTIPVIAMLAILIDRKSTRLNSSHVATSYA